MKKILVLLCSLFLCTSIYASVNQIVVIGDSLTDNGRLYKSLKFIPKSPPYYEGRFTNGPTWAEIVGRHFSSLDTQIFAWGGATAILHNPLYDSFVAPITLDSEIYTYFLNSLLVDKSKVLYIIWIGANDYLYDRQPNMDKLTNHVVDRIEWAVKMLMSQGARQFLVLNLPDLARTPFSHHSQKSQRLHMLAVLHNQKLAMAMQNLQNSNPAAKFVTFDVYKIFNELLDNTNAYNEKYHTNLRNLHDACWTGGMMLNSDTLNTDLKITLPENKVANSNVDVLTQQILNSPSLAVAYSTGKAYSFKKMPCSNAEQYVFWDELHPTETVHNILSQIVVKMISDEGWG